MKFVKHPAFLPGPAASYFKSFLDEEKSSFRLSIESLNRCFRLLLTEDSFIEI